jgi:hypothetical protein
MDQVSSAFGTTYRTTAAVRADVESVLSESDPELFRFRRDLVCKWFLHSVSTGQAGHPGNMAREMERLFNV